MTAQLSLGLQRKREALQTHEERHAVLLAQARQVARQVARQHGTVTIDDVREGMLWMETAPQGCNSFMGNIFRGHEWQAVGRQPSRLETNKGRRVTVYALSP
jgi:hypothetical protein